MGAMRVPSNQKPPKKCYVIIFRGAFVFFKWEICIKALYLQKCHYFLWILENNFIVSIFDPSDVIVNSIQKLNGCDFFSENRKGCVISIGLNACSNRWGPSSSKWKLWVTGSPFWVPLIPGSGPGLHCLSNLYTLAPNS